ncbi:MAG: glycosyl transferase family 2, partial [Muribaculaceae bacterium]|nr:glycosyl transferase family 2 [Muribaculaceae bacterium]
PFVVYSISLLASALLKTRSFKFALLSLPAALVQIVGYGTGFIRAFFTGVILGRGRDINREIELRKGK